MTLVLFCIIIYNIDAHFYARLALLIMKQMATTVGVVDEFQKWARSGSNESFLGAVAPLDLAMSLTQSLFFKIWAIIYSL